MGNPVPGTGGADFRNHESQSTKSSSAPGTPCPIIVNEDFSGTLKKITKTSKRAF